MRRWILSASAFVLAAASLGQIVVYDNTTNSLNNNMPLLPEWLNDSAEAGDEVFLDGGAAEIVQLRLLCNHRGLLTGSVDLRIRFRELDDVLGTPETVFYESPLIHVPIVAGMNTYDIPIPSVSVPHQFVWTVQAFNRVGAEGEFGPAYYNPATVGFSDDFFWLSDAGSEWIQYSWGGDPYANFAARLTAAAVPEPASLAVLTVGALVLARRRRR